MQLKCVPALPKAIPLLQVRLEEVKGRALTEQYQQNLTHERETVAKLTFELEQKETKNAKLIEECTKLQQNALAEQEKVKRLSMDIKRKETKVGNLMQECKELQQNLENSAQRNEAISDQESRYNSLKDENNDLKVTLDLKTEQFTNIETELINLKGTLDLKTEQLAKVEIDLNNLKTERAANIETDIKSLKDENTNLNVTLDQKTEQLAEVETELNNLRTKRVANLEAELRNLETSNASLQDNVDTNKLSNAKLTQENEFLIETKTALEERNRVLQENEKLLRAKITDLNRKCSKISLLKLMRELEHVDAAKKPDLNKFMTVLESCDGEAIETIQQEISAFRERAQTNGWLGKQSGDNNQSYGSGYP